MSVDWLGSDTPQCSDNHPMLKAIAHRVLSGLNRNADRVTEPDLVKRFVVAAHNDSNLDLIRELVARYPKLVLAGHDCGDAYRLAAARSLRSSSAVRRGP